ncbi:hypothetical protein FQA47_013983 [Oryzias melastigma]|uniref:Uncharacterized protein n=1 Tax=Oryzias melastigma TaxID=30732 RepID=A0A834FB15_ORYME|nr:hypothetical protein FQA47_013983 [Oryzias melastigma]
MTSVLLIFSCTCRNVSSCSTQEQEVTEMKDLVNKTPQKPQCDASYPLSVSDTASARMSLPPLAQCIPPLYPHPPNTPTGSSFGRGPWLETEDSNVNEVVLTLPTPCASCSGE